MKPRVIIAEVEILSAKTLREEQRNIRGLLVTSGFVVRQIYVNAIRKGG